VCWQVPQRSGPTVRFSNLWDRSTILADQNVCDFIDDNPIVDRLKSKSGIRAAFQLGAPSG
jgi:hypothetical protein